MKQYNFKTKNGQYLHIEVWGSSSFSKALDAASSSDVAELNLGVSEKA